MCINVEMLPKYTHTHLYVCVCGVNRHRALLITSSGADSTNYFDTLAICPYFPSLLTWHQMSALSCWSAKTGMSMCRSPRENVAHEYAIAFTTIHSVSSLFYLECIC